MTSHWEWECWRLCMSWKERDWWRQAQHAEVYQPWTMKQIKRPHAYPGYLRACQRPRIDRDRGFVGKNALFHWWTKWSWRNYTSKVRVWVRETQRGMERPWWDEKSYGEGNARGRWGRGGVSWIIVTYWPKSQGMLDVVGNESRDLYAEFLLLLKKKCCWRKLLQNEGPQELDFG